MSPGPAAQNARTAAPGPALRWAVPALAWLAGSALQLQMPALWDSRWVWLLTALALALALVAGRFRGRWAALVCVALAALLLGFCTTHLRADARLADRLDANLDRKSVV